MALIFVVEDNENLREAVTSFLKIEDHTVVEFDKLRRVQEAVKTQSPDLLILDVMLPDGDGFILAKKLREKYTVPIIFLTAKDSESSRITGFELGCDDYIVKPFSSRELVLRVKAVLKRSSSISDTPHPVEIWKCSGAELKINRTEHKIFINQKEVVLTASEWKILDHLILKTGIVIRREELLTRCLDYDSGMSERTVITHIRNLRVKLGETPWIETVRGFGYRFTGEKP